MKKTSNLLYSIGFILNILEILIVSLFLAVIILSSQRADVLEKLAQDLGKTLGGVYQTLMGAIIALSVSLGAEVISIVLVLIAKKDLKDNTGKLGVHILILILGILGANILYLLGGLFGLVASNRALNEDDD